MLRDTVAKLSDNQSWHQIISFSPFCPVLQDLITKRIDLTIHNYFKKLTATERQRKLYNLIWIEFGID